MIDSINGFNLTSIIDVREEKGYYKEIYGPNDELKNAIADDKTRQKMVEKFQSFKEEIIADDSEQEKFRKTYYNSLYDFFSGQALSTKDGDNFKIGAFGLVNSGFNADGKVTIWGKYLGYDTSMNADEIAELRDFIDSKAAKIVGFENVKSLDHLTISLLDSADLSIDEFKQKYEKVQDEIVRNFEDLGKGKNGSVEEKSFKPIQAESKNTKTYDINEDDKFLFLLKLQELERERGIDVLRLMQKLEANGEKVFDKKV